MKLSIFTVLVIAFATVALCSSFFFGKLFEPDYEQIADAITARTAKKIECEKKIRLIGTGGGMLGDIYMMAMSFNYCQEVDFDTARRLLVYCVEEYLSAINSDEKLRPYLHNYPFTAKNIEIRIYLKKPNNSDVPLGSICIARSIKGVVSYDANNPNGINLDTLHKETYEEALKIVKDENEKEKGRK